MRTSKEIIQLIKKLRESKKLSVEEFANRVGIAKSTLSRYENEQRDFPINDIGKYADVLGETVEYLLGITDVPGKISTELKLLPIVGRIACGDGGLAYEDIEGYEPTPKEWLNGGEYFYLKAKGDSMTGARIFEGDLLLIRKQEEVLDGEIAAVLIDEDAVLKRVFKRGETLVLQSENPKYAPIVCEAGNCYNVKIIGKLKRVSIRF
jgi:repressor LexA